MVVFLGIGQSGCIRAKWLGQIFGQNWLYSYLGNSGKVVIFDQNWLYLGKLVVFGQNGYNRSKWLYSGKVLEFGQN